MFTRSTVVVSPGSRLVGSFILSAATGLSTAGLSAAFGAVLVPGKLNPDGGACAVTGCVPVGPIGFAPPGFGVWSPVAAAPTPPALGWVAATDGPVFGRGVGVGVFGVSSPPNRKYP